MGLAGAQSPSPEQLRTTGAEPGQTTQQAWVDRTNAGTVGIMTGGVDGTYVRIGDDLFNVLDNGDNLRVLTILGRGSLKNLADMLYLRGVDVAIVQSDVLAYAKMKKLYPGIEQNVQYITRLYGEEVHILARADITSVNDLRGKPVNIDLIGSGTSMTATVMFEALKVEPIWRNDDQKAALEKLRDGEIAAMIYVVGQPAKVFTDIPADTRLHFLPVPMMKGVEGIYAGGVITAADYPNLIAPNGVVPTLAVGSVMAVYNWPVNSERYRKVARFVDAFFTHFEEFQRPPRHRKWLEVDLMADVPGWKRFPEATSWIQQQMHSVPKDFTAFLSTVDLTPAAKNRLLMQYREWQRTITVTAKRLPPDRQQPDRQ